MPKLYLAGPISGLSYEDAAKGWRKEFEDKLLTIDEWSNIECASPMRGKEFLAHMERLGHAPAEMDGYQNPMASSHGIATRDSFDVRTSAAMVAYLLEATAVSVGTVLEIGMAFAHRVPIIGVVPKGPHPHEHGMLLSMIQMNGYLVHTLDEAVVLAYHLLIPGL